MLLIMFSTTKLLKIHINLKLLFYNLTFHLCFHKYYTSLFSLTVANARNN